MNNLLNELKNLFKASDLEHKRDDLVFITVEKHYLPFAIKLAKDNYGFRHLILMTAVDWLEDGFFQVTYLLRNYSTKKDIGIRVFIPRTEPVIESIHNMWETAATYQRELKEMFGIDFPGSPKINEPFILEGWDDIPPYRRDFDTKKYSEETFFPRPGRSTNDPEEYMKKKLYPQEEKDV